MKKTIIMLIISSTTLSFAGDNNTNKDQFYLEYIPMEEDYLIQKSEASSGKTIQDPKFNSQWNLNNVGQNGYTIDADINALEAWKITKGNPNIVVALIDSGVDYNHPDLSANIWTNPNEIPNNGIDDDKNGYIDDVHGISTVENNGNPMDFNFYSHGTFMCGIIAAKDNDIGIIGIAPNIKIMPLKIGFKSNIDTNILVQKAIDYILDMKERGVNIRVVNNSYGLDEFSEVTKNKIQKLSDEGILFVAAAGNNSRNNDTTPHYPASYDVDNVISVANSTPYDTKVFSSNYGILSVDIAAPGKSITSTKRVSLGSYGLVSEAGTSAASAHVSGVAALYFSRYLNATIEEAKTAILSNSDKKEDFSGKTVTGGRLNAYKTLKGNGMQFGECSGSGTFEQHIDAYGGDKEHAVTVGTIPVGIKGLEINLASDADVDIRLYGENEDKIVHWPDGILNEGSVETKPYKGVNVTYSGYDGVGGKKGHEYIKVEGSTPTEMTMKAFGFEEGDAVVDYSWTGKEGCDTNGTFQQDIIKNQVTVIGTIPPNIKNLEVYLNSDKDIDIQLFGEDGTAIAAWSIGNSLHALMSGSTKQEIDYHGMHIEWSGYNGTDGQKGHEYIKITGNSTETLTMKVFGFQSGSAEVNYSWEES